MRKKIKEKPLTWSQNISLAISLNYALFWFFLNNDYFNFIIKVSTIMIRSIHDQYKLIL